MADRILGWFKDRALQKVVKFGIPAALGKVVMSVAGLVTMALLAHHLGPAPFGVIAVIRTVVGIVDQYANFNTWQAVVKFGAEAVARQRRADVGRIIKLAVVIDLATAVLAALIVALLALVIPATFDWTPKEGLLCALYGVTLFTRVSGASDGIFRICDAYRAQAISSSLAAGTITVAVAIAVAIDASLVGCVYALILGEVIGNVIITLASFRVATETGYGGWLRMSLRGIRGDYPGIVRFLFATNAQLTVKKTATELDMVIVGAMLGKVASGLFRVVKQLGTIPGRIFMPFEQVVFTELARAAASKDYRGFRRLLKRFSALVALGSLVVWAIASLAAGPMIEILAGEEFLAAAWPFRWYLLAMVLVIANAPVLRALVSLGRPGTLFLAESVTLAVLAACLVLGANLWGLTGVSIAVVVHRALQMLWSTWMVERVLRTHERELASQGVAVS